MAPSSKWTIKLNVDASFCQQKKEVVLGLVARDILFPAATRCGFVSYPLHAEVQAISWCLDVARDQGITNFLVENDSLLAIKEI
ncbi:hypothetical protein REPUB_Repub12eG0029700 [Reevesia pubescens]